MDFPENNSFSDLLGIKIADKHREIIGQLDDAIFTVEKEFHLSKFVTGGSGAEDFLEKIKIKPDRDPVFKVEDITSITDTAIILSKPRANLLETNTHKNAIRDNEILFSNLKKYKIIDNQGEKIGHPIDFKYTNNRVQLLIGGGFFRDLIESIGLIKDIEFIIHQHYIVEILDKTITISKSKKQLQQVIADHEKDHSDDHPISFDNPEVTL